ncbi:MAG: hypothetical protein HYT63_02945 [Candidatus Yanofskybacteria bacterium]|nr:hypothetical protein [Candidatus Yanofskybacteria bacterium]
MFGRGEITKLGTINPNPDKAEIPENIEKVLETKDTKSLEVSYLQKQIAAFEVYKDMIGSEKGTEDYKRLKEDWMEKRAEITKHEESMPAELLEEYAGKYNSSEKKVRQKLAELGGSVSTQEQSPIAGSSGGLDEKHKWRILWGLGPGEKLSKDKEKDVKKHIEMLGGNTLSRAYAENLLKDMQEQDVREEAEEHRDEVADLESENEELEKQLRAERDREVEVFEEPNDPEISRLEGESEEKKEELKEKKQGWGEKFKKGVKSLFEKRKKENKKEDKKTEETIDTRTPEEKIASGEEYLDESGFIHNQKEGKGYKKVNGFLAERAKGFVGGLGWWESHQAEKFRLGTKEAGIDSKAQAQLIEQEEGLLDFDDAWEEAHEIERKRVGEERVFKEKYGVGEKEARYAAIMWLSDKISQRKKEYNQKVEDKIVALALAKLEEKLKNKSWVEEYKAAYGGAVISPEKMQEVEKKMREKIGELRKGQSKKDLVDFIKLSRQSLDKNWWHRYIYTAVDAVLAGLMLKWVVGKYLGGKAVEAVAGKGGAGKALEWGMKDHVWGETKRFLIQKGVDPRQRMGTKERDFRHTNAGRIFAKVYTRSRRIG